MGFDFVSQNVEGPAGRHRISSPAMEWVREMMLFGGLDSKTLELFKYNDEQLIDERAAERVAKSLREFLRKRRDPVLRIVFRFGAWRKNLPRFREAPAPYRLEAFAHFNEMCAPYKVG
ncbi:MAG: hypothetical protein A2V88_09330 [Elusimicrobia bacterium RBG_16_66_12]|nr:MAG: hypothetical protein A2V88_09330 [Elusimicrobia bacterium RBG_16_66_12]